MPFSQKGSKMKSGMTTWQEALDQAFAQGYINNSGSVWIYNAEFREGHTSSCTSAGAIEMDGGGQLTAVNASTATEIKELSEDEVDETLARLGVADSDWSSILGTSEYAVQLAAFYAVPA